MEGIITRKQAKNLLAGHHLGFNTQTELNTENNEYMQYGSSFDEVFGVKETYNFKSVREWLGY